MCVTEVWSAMSLRTFRGIGLLPGVRLLVFGTNTPPGRAAPGNIIKLDADPTQYAKVVIAYVILDQGPIMWSVNRKPTSPGEILREEYLKSLGITQAALAIHVGCDVKVINRIVNERAGVTAEVALKLAAAFATSANFWLNAQQALDLYHASRSVKSMPRSLMKRRIQSTTPA